MKTGLRSLLSFLILRPKSKRMGSLLLGLISVLFFCFCAHYFAKAIITPMPGLNQTGYTRAALRMQRNYKIFALGVMTFVFLIGLVISFAQVFLEL